MLPGSATGTISFCSKMNTQNSKQRNQSKSLSKSKSIPGKATDLIFSAGNSPLSYRRRCAPASCKPEHSNVRAARGRAYATILDKNMCPDNYIL